MKYNFMLSICAATLLAMRPAGAVSYIPLGGQCEPGNTQILCMPPTICFASPDGSTGYCISSCDTELDDPLDYDKNTWMIDVDSSKQSRNCASCDSWSNCTPTKQYRCNYNYYGDPDRSIACVACPDGGASLAGAKKITNCYLPPGSNGKNTAGAFEIKNGNCPYVL